MAAFEYAENVAVPLPSKLQTERLVFERICAETISAIDMYELITGDDDADKTTEYVTFSPHNSPQESMEFINHCEERWENGSGADYLIRPKGEEEYAGTTSMSLEWDRLAATFGIWLRRKYWGQGYSGERGEAFLELVFEELDMEIVEVTAAVENEQSQRAIEKYIVGNGGRYDGMLRRHIVTDSGDVFDVEHYSITREEWLTSRA